MVVFLLLLPILFLAALVLLFFVRPKVAVGTYVLLSILFAWVFWFEPRRLVLSYQQVEVSGLSEPIKVVAIGDPQPTTFHWRPDRLRKAFERAQEEDPDIVLWLGDYAYEGGLYRRLGIRDYAFVEPADVVEAMAMLNAPMGAYAILGNHDWWWDGAEVARLIRETHIRLLIDEAAYAQHPEKDAALWIAGLDDISTPRTTDLEKVLSDTDSTAPVIVLSHSPDIFPRIPTGPALTLSGHTHCGQVLIPFVGRPVVPIEHKRYACGLYDVDGRRLYVTSGIGTAIIPIRFLTPPEIAVIELVGSDASAPSP